MADSNKPTKEIYQMEQNLEKNVDATYNCRKGR
jgi:hypothetical protein